MKYFITITTLSFFLFSCFSAPLFAQTDTTDASLPGLFIPKKEKKAGNIFSKDAYLKKSRHQRTAGIILISGGGAAIAGGGLIILAHGISEGVSTATNIIGGLGGMDNGREAYNRPAPKKHNNSFAKALMVTGAFAMLGSIPLFESAKENKHKALSLSFKNEFAPGLQNNVIVNRPVPALSLMLKF